MNRSKRNKSSRNATGKAQHSKPANSRRSGHSSSSRHADKLAQRRTGGAASTNNAHKISADTARSMKANRADDEPIKLLLFNKPFDVLSQFTDQGDRDTLANYIDTKRVYPAGRLDRDSEGLLLLTNDGILQHRISHPDTRMPKEYLVQVDGQPDDNALRTLARGVKLKDGMTQPAEVAPAVQPDWLWPRTPPIRYRKDKPTGWIRLTITEGRNRQVRRMTAAVGYPTLRLIRIRVGAHSLDSLQPGEFRELIDP